MRSRVIKSPRVINGSRALLAKAVRNRIAGDDFASVHARIWESPGERWFSSADAIWQVHADTSMFIGGIRALLLQSLHPVPMWAVHEHSGYRGDPWGRLQRISHFLAVTTYGPIDAAEQRIDQLRRIHQQIRGTTPAGTSYSADDPDLLAWIHAAEIDSFLRAHQAFGQTPLTPARCDDYVAQTAATAEKLGVRNAPRTVAELAKVLQSYRPVLHWTPPVGDVVDLLVKDAQLPAYARPAYAALVGGAVALLPAWTRTELRFPAHPVTERVLTRPAARLATSTIRWALSGPGPQGAV